MVFLTHRLAPSIVDRFRKMSRELPATHRIFLGFDATDPMPDDLEKARAVAGDTHLHLFDHPRLRNASRNRKKPWRDAASLLPGDMDIMWLDFSRRHSGFDRYWFVEYDVAYTGHWSTFFRPFAKSGADLLGTTLLPHSLQPEWPWWSSLATGHDRPFPVGRRIRGFFPVVGLSRQALGYLDRGHRHGWSGHFEVLVPTLFHQTGLEIEDFGGDGPFVQDGNVDRFYTNTPSTGSGYPGTFVYRPARPRPGLKRRKLWHPVKPDCGRFLPYLQMAREWVAARMSG